MLFLDHQEDEEEEEKKKGFIVGGTRFFLFCFFRGTASFLSLIATSRKRLR